MKNWAGNLTFEPRHIYGPSSVSELQNLVTEVAKKNGHLRLRGSGHSWTGLIETQDTFVHLDNLQGLISAFPQEQHLKVYAGTKLFQLGALAHQQGLAMPNQGDINKQSLAGAISTGTHGTGLSLQSVSNQIHELTCVLASGEIITINANRSDLFAAARLSLGSLGIISDITLQMVSAYKLHVRTCVEDMSQTMLQLRERLKNHRHVEMFYFPLGDWSIVKVMDPTDEPETKKSFFDTFSEVVLENWSYELLNILAKKTGKYKGIDAFMKKFLTPVNRIGYSHDVFPTQRSLKFMEMEYNLPLEHFEAAFEEIKAAIKTHNFQTLFPIEIRFVKGDSLWLSPAYERDSVYFAVHTYITEDYYPYFTTLEKIFKKYQGRPHWGKWHNLGLNDLEKLYPKFHDFKKLRSELDPQGIFLNDHLKKIFGI